MPTPSFRELYERAADVSLPDNERYPAMLATICESIRVAAPEKLIVIDPRAPISHQVRQALQIFTKVAATPDGRRRLNETFFPTQH